MFVDQVVIVVQAGHGGDGCVSFHREKFVSKGGPNGGNGGSGGDVIFRAEEGLNTLIDFRGVRHWNADSGEPGRGKQQHGAAAKDRVIRVPPGTLVYNNQTGEPLADIGPGDEIVIARGGRGGFGNEHFKGPTNQVPTQFTPGGRGERRELRLELKLIAEVGLVGMPNAGKSTLLKSLTRADPKIADYPFTTLSPQLGIAELDPARRIVLADIPGLIEGASEGHGLGHDFLRHVERTRVILHLLDCDPASGTPANNYRAIRAELAGYSSELAEKPELIALNKVDLFGADEAMTRELIAELRADLQLGADVEVLPLSGAAGVGTAALLEHLWRMVHPRGGGERPGWKDAPATAF